MFLNLQHTNIGEIKAGGYDVTANVFPINKPNLTARVFVNTSWSWAFVTKLGGAPPLKVGGSYPRYRNFVKEGYPIGALFGAKLPGPCSARPAGATHLCLSPGQLADDVTGPARVPGGPPGTGQQTLAHLSEPPLASDCQE